MLNGETGTLRGEPVRIEVVSDTEVRLHPVRSHDSDKPANYPPDVACTIGPGAIFEPGSIITNPFVHEHPVSRAITGSIIAARWVQQERDRLGNPAFVDVLAYADAHHPGWRDA